MYYHSLNIAEVQQGDAVLLTLSGHLTMGDSSGGLKTHLEGVVPAKGNNIIINLAELTYVDSYGVGELVACLTTIKKSGGALRLVNPTEFVREVLHTTRLDTLFTICDTDEEAAASIARQDQADAGEQGAR